MLLTQFFVAPVNAQAVQSGRQILNVLNYGAHNDGSAPSTEAFQRAIESAKIAGGGTVYVPAGRYISGPIELFSNITLDIGAGATIDFPVAPLPFVQGRYLGVEALVPAPLIGGTDVENVTITGRGTLVTGDYAAWGRAYGPAPASHASGNANGPLWQNLLQKLEAHQPVSPAEYRAAAAELRPSFICFTRAKNVVVENIRLQGGPMFIVHLLYSENATVQNVIVDSYPGPHTNGIVADSSRFVRIFNDYIDTGDDGIVIKSGKDADGLRVNRPSEDIAIANCTVHHAHGAVVIGSETSGGIRNVVASNITAVDTENGIRIKSRRGRGGVVEDIRFDNWTMENVGTAIDVDSYYVMGGESSTQREPVSERTPVFRDIAISNVAITGAKAVATIQGLPEMPINSLWLSGIIGSGKTGIAAKNTDDLTLHSVEVNAQQGPAFTIADSTNLELDDVTSRDPLAQQPVIRLTRSPGAILRSRAFPGTATFLSADPAELKTIHLEANFFRSGQNGNN
ncbi:MAG TPA: glycoside hydrolase family 28 protein [Acidobacteriaceae bacterium]|jgi:polygalacturonase|nr:glycoside hydrolase family 28 protein [Acidobacteriaceae bacterium]